MSCVLITGSSRGIGLEFARQYAAADWSVLATCREPERAAGLGDLPANVSLHVLDVADHASIDRLANRLRGVAIDLLINNAGIYGTHDDGLGAIDYTSWEAVFRVNAIGALKMAEAFQDHLARSRLRLLVAIGSRMGSVGMNSRGGNYFYRASKAALNALHRSLAIDLAAHGITAVVLSPGWVRTEMAFPGAPQSAAESVGGMRRVIARLTPADTGKFFDYDGRELPW
ncbi:MAG: SDR family oxidoreductase [Alphaproteobacteria bacterium]|nr:SDR family oxidoreductase [Alphaproteobacteria bacterium]